MTIAVPYGFALDATPNFAIDLSSRALLALGTYDVVFAMAPTPVSSPKAARSSSSTTVGASGVGRHEGDSSLRRCFRSRGFCAARGRGVVRQSCAEGSGVCE